MKHKAAIKRLNARIKSYSDDMMKSYGGIKKNQDGQYHKPGSLSR